MRDIALTAFVIGLIPYILANPYIGALAWAWIGIMNPHRLTFGFAYDIPFALIVGVTTLIALPFSRTPLRFPWSAPAVFMLLFYLWTCVTSLTGIGHPEATYDLWLKVTKIMLMLFVTLLVIRDRKKIELLVWVIVLSLGFYGSKGGVFTLTSGGGERVWGPEGSFIEGNNEIGLALIVMIPLAYYLIQTLKDGTIVPRWHKWVRAGLWGCIGLSAVSSFGTHSRGALLAMGAMAFLLAIKSKRKALALTALALILAGSLAVMHDKWWDRMGTIATYEEDGSAQGRLQSWAMHWNLAVDRPLVGGGHDFLSKEENWYRYSQVGLPRAAHSIYFQVLGDHGFVGLALYLLIGFSTWRMAKRLEREFRQEKGCEWVPILMRMAQVSLVAFGVGGAFLSLANWDVPYYIAAIVVMVGAAMKEARSEKDTVLRARGATAARDRASRQQPAMSRFGGP